MAKKDFSLKVLFSEEERKVLRGIATREGREEGPQIKWLVKQYSEGKLVPELLQKHDLTFFIEQKMGNLALEIARLRDEIAKRAKSGGVVTAVESGELPEEDKKVDRRRRRSE